MYHQHPSAASSANPNVRDDALLETNFSDDEVQHGRAFYNMNRSQNGIVIYNRRRSTYRSDQSVDRYTDRGNGKGRQPYTLPPYLPPFIVRQQQAPPFGHWFLKGFFYSLYGLTNFLSSFFYPWLSYMYFLH